MRGGGGRGVDEGGGWVGDGWMDEMWLIAGEIEGGCYMAIDKGWLIRGVTKS